MVLRAKLTRLMPKSPIKQATCAVLGLVASSISLFAQPIPPDKQTWIESQGVFEEAANWDTGQAPQANSYVIFAPDPELNVTLGTTSEVVGLDVQGTGGGDSGTIVNFDLGGNLLSVGLSSEFRDEKFSGIHIQSIRHVGTGRRTLILRNGTLIAGSLNLSRSPDPEFSSLVVAEGAELQSPGTVGNVGRAELIVRDGGQWISEGLHHYVGRVAGELTEGIVRVTGANSLWQAIGSSTNQGIKPIVGIAAGGNGLLEVLDGAKMETFILQLAGHQKHMETPFGVGRGKVLVAGAGSSIECAHLYVGGGVERALIKEIQPGGVGTVELSSGGTLNCGSMVVFPFSTLSFRSGSLNQTGVYEDSTIGGATVIEPGAVLHYVLEEPLKQAPLNGTDVKITGSTLDVEVSPNFNFPIGTVFPLISTDGFIEGTFDKLEEGATLNVGKHTFTISYGNAGTGPVSLQLTRTQ